MQAEQGGWSQTVRATHDHSPHRKGKTMAEPQETRQEKETRWAAQRVAHDKDQQARQGARQRKTAKTWVIVGAIVLIVAVIAMVVLR
jgi:CHASE3 domain sensor protein